ncbi:hypothetical protein PsorP6_013036 [Peronosclerospora sorghi]|uniref:Uncharacterized protein n=1 Tax=Peronosclerospora sorghi TaxID=230839 RepID=A0ACC0WFG6_9STRA|nr:hypothetical protein PsorP6_013036 [Peronosclerospora sorghi]
MQTPLFAYPSPKTDIFQNVTKSVSNFALRKVNEKSSQTWDELELARRPVQAYEKPCPHAFTTVWGMPFQHRLRELISEDKRLSLNDFHPHWHIVERPRPEAIERPEDHLPVVLEQVAKNVAKFPDHQQRATIQHLHDLSQQLPCLIKEPEVVRTKGRPRTSTKRNPSGFEYVEQTQKRRKAENCSACGGVGNRKTLKNCPAQRAPSTSASALRAPTDGPTQGTPVFSIPSAQFPMAPIALSTPYGFQLLGGYQIVTPAADGSFMVPLGFNPQPGAIGGGGLGHLGHPGDGDRNGNR